MQFIVKGKYIRGAEKKFNEFNELNKAKEYVENKLKEDGALSVKVIYRIYEFVNFEESLIQEYDPSKINSLFPHRLIPSKEEQSSQGKTSSTSFRATPFNVTLKPAGLPQKWVVNEEDKKNK